MNDEVLFAQLETRVRKLMKDLLEPVYKRLSQNKETTREIQKTTDNTKDYITGIEGTINSLIHKYAMVDDYSKKFMEYEGQLRSIETSFAKEQDGLHNLIESYVKRIGHVEERVNFNTGQQELFKIDISRGSSEIKTIKANIDERLHSYKEENKRTNNELTEKMLELQNRLIGIEINYGQLSRDLCEVDVTARKGERLAEQAKEGHKVINNTITKLKARQKEQTIKLSENNQIFFNDIKSKIDELKRYLDNDHTIDILLQVNETLNTLMIDPRIKRKLAELESVNYEKWESWAVSNDIKEKILVAQNLTAQVLGTPIPPAGSIDRRPRLRDQSSTSSLASSQAGTRKILRRNYNPKRTFQSANNDEKNDSMMFLEESGKNIDFEVKEEPEDENKEIKQHRITEEPPQEPIAIQITEPNEEKSESMLRIPTQESSTRENVPIKLHEPSNQSRPNSKRNQSQNSSQKSLVSLIDEKRSSHLRTYNEQYDQPQRI